MSTPDQPLFPDDVPSKPEPPPTQPLPPDPTLQCVVRPRPQWEQSEIVALLRYLYNHNPFYPISAALILLGLHYLFYDAESARNITAINFNSGILLGVLACYAVLLAVIVCLIVRLGEVWDDARTILLTIVLLLVTLSINGDKPILMHSGSAPWFLVSGLIFSVLLCETVLALTRIPLPWSLRGPFYLFLALFFLYPLGLDYCLNTIGNEDAGLGKRLTLAGVLLFPTAAAAVGLCLIPAARRGRSLVAANRTPWHWPLYPWSLFAILGVAVMLRAFYLTVSFHPRQGMESAFQAYFLTPFCLSGALILFEIVKSADLRGVPSVLLWCAAGVIPASLPGHQFGAAAEFLNLHREFAGAPIQIACVGVALLWGYAAWRGGPRWCGAFLPLPIGLLACTRNDTLNLASFGPPTWPPLAAATALLILGAARARNSSFRWSLAVIGGLGTLTVAWWGSPWTHYRGAAPLHLLLLALVIINLVCDDAFTPVLRRLVAIAFIGLACGLVTYSARSFFAPNPWTTLGYVAALGVATWLIWRQLRGADEMTAAVIVSGAVVIQIGIMAAAAIRSARSPQGIAMLLSGACSLAVAAGISALKVRRQRRLSRV